jgi:alpha-tubulin suppressor-like RCC1 family protein
VRGFLAGQADSATSSAWYRVGALVAHGADFSFALSSGGALSSWGANDYGQLGDGQTVTVLGPRLVTGISGVDRSRVVSIIFGE